MVKECPYALFTMQLKCFDRVGKLAIRRQFQLSTADGQREITRIITLGENLQLSTCRPANTYTQIYISHWDMQFFTTIIWVPTFSCFPSSVSSYFLASCRPVQKTAKRKQTLISGGWIRDSQPKPLCLAQYFCFALWVITCTCEQWAKQSQPALCRIWPHQCRGNHWVPMVGGQWCSDLSPKEVNGCTRCEVKEFVLDFP